MEKPDKRVTTVISGEYNFPGDAKTTAQRIDVDQGSYIPRHAFSATTQVGSTSLVRINKQLSGDFSVLASDTKGIRSGDN